MFSLLSLLGTVICCVAFETRAPSKRPSSQRRHYGFATSPDAALKTALPLLLGDWTLQEDRMSIPLWGTRAVQPEFPLDPGRFAFAIKLLSRGKLDSDHNDNQLKGLDWSLDFKDIYAQGRMEFRIVHPPPAIKWTVNDQIPSCHYYSGSFKEGLGCVEGYIERYADILDERLGLIRRRVKIGHFRLIKTSTL